MAAGRFISGLYWGGIAVGHDRWMQRCLELAARGKGYVSPNPKVGAVLVGADGEFLGEGWHVRYGETHAEENAISDAERRHGTEALRKATLYVNLEPCNHVGKTFPCVDLILKKGIPRVVVGMPDPNMRAAGGTARLREHGVHVTPDILLSACQRLNEPFIHHLATGRPLVTLKIAQTLDGRVAPESGDARWITGEKARMLVHKWRAEVDGILVGSTTARLDNPSLTVRHVSGNQPHRVILDRTGILPDSLQVLTDRFCDHTTVVVGKDAEPSYADAFIARQGCLLRMDECEGHLDLGVLLDYLGKDRGRGALPLQSLLVEAGPRLASALLRQNIVDRIFVFIAPKVLGSGRPPFEGLGIQTLVGAVTFAEHRWEQVGEDILFRGYRR